MTSTNKKNLRGFTIPEWNSRLESRRKLHVKRAPTADNMTRVQREIEQLKQMVNMDGQTLHSLQKKYDRALAEIAKLRQERNELKQHVRLLNKVWKSGSNPTNANIKKQMKKLSLRGIT